MSKILFLQTVSYLFLIVHAVLLTL